VAETAGLVDLRVRPGEFALRQNELLFPRQLKSALQFAFQLPDSYLHSRRIFERRREILRL